ncbi:hypothetical protein EG328_004065 [Venturia inaequalis]|uniref:Fibronectin type-III domain-containing protein n=2 Tax=Venturia inaequalis TaxID=5025 RepID=A0A8H3VSQ1_VENIN|nr:hypothetical protein EG328_004065 [Venturia inaequalis]KAE9993811.1 hypothetical protein EG327_003060 [Venturia inaequalis]
MPSEEFLLLLAGPLLSYYPNHNRPNSEMERFVHFALAHSTTTIVFSALAWLLLRFYQVLSKPSDELISLLGLEVPIPPALSLAGIRADGVVLNWKAPDQQKTTTVKHYIHINGVNVGELSPQETSIAVTGLRPETNYIIRVIAVNPSNFEAKSEAIRVQTKPATSKDFFQESLEPGTTLEMDDTVIPTIQPCKMVADPTAALPAAPPMHREHSGSFSQQKRGPGGRRSSPAVLANEDHDSAAYDGSISDLTLKLDKLRSEIEISEGDLTKEDEEYETSQASLTKQKNDLKQAVADKEGASKSLKKQAQDLTNQNSVAQGKRMAAEKQLQLKQQERQKLRDEIDRWEQEIVAMHADAEKMAVGKVTYREETDQKLSELKEEHAKETARNKLVEDTLRTTITKIKDLETEKEHLDQECPEIAPGAGSFTLEEDMTWRQHMQNLHVSYGAVASRLAEAQQWADEAQMNLVLWQQRRNDQPQLFASTPQLEPIPGRRHSQRGSQAMSLRNELSPSGPIFGDGSAPPYTASMSNISPAFPNALPLPVFNMKNGTLDHLDNGTTLQEHMRLNGMTQEEEERLTAGALTSPSVPGAFALPTGLLGDEMEPTRSQDFYVSSNRSSPVNTNILPGLGAPQTLRRTNGDPSSPHSNQSGSPRMFASPKASMIHLPFSPESNFMKDSDRRSIHSTTSSFRNNGSANTTTRFANLFGFSRQRGKTFSDEGPALGTLKPSERQSFPRQDGTENTSRLGFGRRGSSSGSNWMGNLGSAFSRNSDPPPAAMLSASKRRFNMFSGKNDGWTIDAIGDRPTSPRRPDSSASSEHVLPKPSSDAQARFGWGDAHRQSPLGADWAPVATNSWSRHPSRRPSIQHGNSHGYAENSFLDGGIDMEYGMQRRSPKLAPIGTRPASQVSTGSAEKPRLNPAAPSFTINALFTRDKKEKAEKESKPKTKKSKGKEKELLVPETPSTAPPSFTFEDVQTPDANDRRKYAGSISTTGDTNETRDSLEQTNSRTPSQADPSVSGQKETLMQKLSRKSSASMFNFPGFGKEKSGRFKKTSQQGDHGTPDETDEEATSMNSSRTPDLSRSFEFDRKGGSSPLIGGQERNSKEKDRSSGFLRSLRRHKGDKTPSLHESITSDQAEEDESAESWTAL